MNSTIFEMNKESLINFGIKKGLKQFQAKDVYIWLFNRRVEDPLRWSNLPKNFRIDIKEEFDFFLPKVIKEEKSIDGTVKLLMELKDGSTIESVYIPSDKRITLCISTQVGCFVGCIFCLTAKGGFLRNLKSSEILTQIMVLEKRFSLFGKKYNIVIMGMGEPLLNYDNLLRAFSVMLDNEGLAISRRRITLSTVGIKEKLEKYLEDKNLPPIAISLHSAIEEKRRHLVPSKIILSVNEIRQIIQKVSRRERERISIEYVMLKDFNDKEEDAFALVKFCKGLKVKVNLIPFNESRFLKFQTPNRKTIIRFQDILSSEGISTTIRSSKGKDINAACGLLSNIQRNLRE